MKQFLDRFILWIPVLFIKQYPFAWLAVVAFWPDSPLWAALFLLIIVVGILALRWQRSAWISQMRRIHAGRDGKFYIDEPPVVWNKIARNLAILIALSIVMAFILRDQFGLTFWQYIALAIGFTILYRDTRFFGFPVTYIITATGIGIRLVLGHLDYRLFFPFKEISRIERGKYKKQFDTDIFARTQEAGDGLLLIPKDPRGFSKRIDKLFIVPQNVDKFVEQLPYGYGN
jgi:hypothetical protein